MSSERTVKELKEDIKREIEATRTLRETGSGFYYEYKDWQSKKDCERLEKLLNEIIYFEWEYC